MARKKPKNKPELEANENSEIPGELMQTDGDQEDSEGSSPSIESENEENEENGGNAGSSHTDAGASSPQANKHYSNHPKFDKFKKGTDQ